jgi:deoxyribonuclease IV
MDETTDTLLPVPDIEDEYRPEPVLELRAPHWADGSVRIGIHTSIAGDIAEALTTARKLGCNALQIFSGSPRMWPASTSGISEADAERFRARRTELELGPLVVHANYLINLASSDPMMRVRSIQAFRGEILRALDLGADFLVIHPGSAGAAKAADAIPLASESLRQASRGIRFETGRARQKQSGGLRILIENTSGMGSAIGVRFEELRAILDGAPGVPLGICLDTAHAFEAGYEIHTADGLDSTLAELDSVVGLRHLYVVHTNDSKTAFGSRVDRHQHIGKGAIGVEAFRRLLTHPRLSAKAPDGLAGRVFILETPIDVPGDDRRNVRALWELAGFDVEQAPDAEDGFSMLRKARVVAEVVAAVPAALKAVKAPAKKTATRGAKSPKPVAAASAKSKRSKQKPKTKR